MNTHGFVALIGMGALLASLPLGAACGRGTGCLRDLEPRPLVVGDSVVASLRADLFAAYDASRCDLVRLWQGGLAVDDEEVRPLSVSKRFVEAVQGPSWGRVDDAGKFHPAEVRLVAVEHAPDAGVGVRLLYDVVLGGDIVSVSESLVLLGGDEAVELLGLVDFDHEGRLVAVRREFRFRGADARDLALRWNRSVRTISAWPGFEGSKDSFRADDSSEGAWEPLVLRAAGSSASIVQVLELM